MSHPVIPYGNRRPLLEEIRKSAFSIATKLFDKKAELFKEESDFEFLGRLGKLRNWRDKCAICLEEDFMGTTCGCGHTEIVIFRPCGHSMCASPCFQSFMQSRGTVLKDKIIIVDGQEFSISGQKNIDLDVELTCPLCVGKVSKTFRAESVWAPNGFAQELIDEAVKKIMLNLS